MWSKLGRKQGERKQGEIVTKEEPILDEAMDDLKESAQRRRATQNRLRASGLV
jgi:hypothetical protein